jgi:hypothetical protein
MKSVCYETVDGAALVYNKKAVKIFGKFAYVNPI